MANKIKIDLGYAILVAEQGADESYPEVFVCLEDRHGTAIQDLAVVGSQYHYGEDQETVLDKGISVKVWCDPDHEDWTTEHNIPVRDEGFNPFYDSVFLISLEDNSASGRRLLVELTEDELVRLRDEVNCVLKQMGSV